MHEAVIAAGEKESGITIHYVNNHYDEGAAIFQARCEVTPEDTPDSLAAKIHDLEYRVFSKSGKTGIGEMRVISARIKGIYTVY